MTNWCAYSRGQNHQSPNEALVIPYKPDGMSLGTDLKEILVEGVELYEDPKLIPITEGYFTHARQH